MIVSAIPIYWILLWAIFVTFFYIFRYKKIEFLQSTWGISMVFAVNVLFFGWGVLFLLITEFIRSKIK